MDLVSNLVSCNTKCSLHVEMKHSLQGADKLYVLNTDYNAITSQWIQPLCTSIAQNNRVAASLKKV